MPERIFEILEATKTMDRLTITPTRVTVKFLKDTTDEDRKSIIKIAKNIEKVHNFPLSLRAGVKLDQGNVKLQTKYGTKYMVYDFDGNLIRQRI